MKKKIGIGIGIFLILLIIGGIITNYELPKSNTIEIEYEGQTISKMNKEQGKNENYFYGKIMEATNKYIIVEPNKEEKVRESSDKISIGLEENSDVVYMVGTNVKITYDGTIMDSYPAQVKAIKIEVKSAENFEILFYDKHPMESYKVYTILDKSETDKYDYTIYGYDGSVNIRIDEKDYSLKEALLQNKITMEEIIAKANQDEKDGNRDVYIGTKDLKLNDVIQD